MIPLLLYKSQAQKLNDSEHIAITLPYFKGLPEALATTKLWVAELWATLKHLDDLSSHEIRKKGAYWPWVYYAAGTGTNSDSLNRGNWRTASSMPIWASRFMFTLEDCKSVPINLDLDVFPATVITGDDGKLLGMVAGQTLPLLLSGEQGKMVLARYTVNPILRRQALEPPRQQVATYTDRLIGNMLHARAHSDMPGFWAAINNLAAYYEATHE